jgi:hypothetical protein
VVLEGEKIPFILVLGSTQDPASSKAITTITECGHETNGNNGRDASQSHQQLGNVRVCVCSTVHVVRRSISQSTPCVACVVVLMFAAAAALVGDGNSHAYQELTYLPRSTAAAAFS